MLEKNIEAGIPAPFASADDNIGGHPNLVKNSPEKQKFTPEMFKILRVNMSNTVSRFIPPLGFEDAFQFSAKISPKVVTHGEQSR
jgi:hypothetical protein